jgi:hypothetical protein
MTIFFVYLLSEQIKKKREKNETRDQNKKKEP